MDHPADLAAAFLSQLPGCRRDAARLAKALAAALLSARSQAPTVRLDGPAFARHLARCVRPEGPLATAVEELAAGDLYVAAACLQHQPGALALLEAVLWSVAEDVRRISSSSDMVAEVIQLLRVKLLIGEGSSGPRLADYQGRAPLVAWVRTAALRIALGQMRTRTGQLSAGDQQLLDQVVDLAADPELQLIQLRHRVAFKEAFSRALLTLSARERLLLRLRFLEGLELDEIARFSALHRSTVVRSLAQLRDELLRQTRVRLKDSLQLDSASLDSLLRTLHDGFQLSLERMMRRFAEPESNP